MILDKYHREAHIRFFQAIDALMAEGISQRTICGKTRIDRRNLFAYREMGRVPLAWVISLVIEFGISAEWLLTGKGKMFN